MSISHDIEKRIRETIESYDLIHDGDRVLIGLSGGPDSVALLLQLVNLRKSYRLTLGAVYVNHQLRPRAAKKEEAFCWEICNKHGFEFFTRTVDIPSLAKKDKTGIEACARTYRYTALEDVAAKWNADAIALGHHRDDRVETILFNLFRGAGRTGAMGFQPKRGHIIRPLYDIWREEIERYLAEIGQISMLDSSNAQNDYTRNRLRNVIIPKIRSEIHDNAPANILRFATVIGDEERFLSEYTAKTYHELHSVTPGGKNRLDLNSQKAYDVWFVRRLLFRLLEDSGVDEIGFSVIERLISAIEGRKSGRIQLAPGLYAECTGGHLYVYRSGEKIGRYAVQPGDSIELAYPRLQMKLESRSRIDIDEIRREGGRVAYIDADRLAGTLEIAGIKRGATIHPFGRPGKKKVGDFLTDRKYPRPLRDELPVLYDREGVVWLAGIEIDNRVAVTKETRKIVRIEIRGFSITD
ncbi:MAG: tRNA lysidine(34) synthetase TilS [Candidatus Zixiibacteriota bacterium]